jgi:hypothetical protein
MNQKIVLLVLVSVLLAPSVMSNNMSTCRAILWFLPGAQSNPYWSNPEILTNVSRRFRDTAFYHVLNEKCRVTFLTDENATQTIGTIDFDLIVLVDAMANWTMNHLVMEAFNGGKPILAINTGIFGLNFTFAYGFYPIQTNITITEEHPIFNAMSDVIFRISDPNDLMCKVMCEVSPEMKIVTSYNTPFNASDPMIVVYQPVINKKAVIVLCDWRSGDNPFKDQGLMSKFIDNTVNWMNLNEVDLNSDGIVDMLDIAIVAKAYGSYPEHPRWNPIADLNHDDIINIVDVGWVCKKFGKTA